MTTITWQAGEQRRSVEGERGLGWDRMVFLLVVIADW